MVRINVIARRAEMRLWQLAREISDPRVPLEVFARHMERSIQRNFDEEGRPRKWRPLSPMTLMAWVSSRRTWVSKTGRLTAQGRAALAGRKILTDTGRLRRSITGRVWGNRLVIGTNVEYAPYHQYGTSRIPARPFLLFQAEDLEFFRRLIARWLAR